MQLHLIVDCTYHAVETLLHRAAACGVTHVQLRDKHVSTPEMIKLGKSLQAILKPQGIPLIINDRLDIALSINADGVHLGQSDMPYREARSLLGKDKIIGLTVETTEQASLANQWAVDYIGVGPIFTTQTKLDAPLPMKIEGLKEISWLTHHPIIAVGGIDLTNIHQVLTTNIAGIAVSAAINKAEKPIEVSQQLRQCLNARKI